MPPSTTASVLPHPRAGLPGQPREALRDAASPWVSVYRFELAKLLAQWRIRVVLAACWVLPAIFVAVVSQQSSLPTDTVFGRWMATTGWAGSLVVLSFCCQWALPLLTCLVAGDVFAVEDRLGTWRHLVMAVRSTRRIFVAKATASLTLITVMVIGLAASSTIGGLLAVGNHDLVGLDGRVLAPGDAATRVLLAWAYAGVAGLVFAAVGLLSSIVLGRSPMGLLTPAVLAFGLQLAQLLPLPVSVRLALPNSAFLTWRGLFTSPEQTHALVAGLCVSVVWAVAATALAYALFIRRDFTDLGYDGSGRRALIGTAPLAGVLAVSIGLLAITLPGPAAGGAQNSAASNPTGITKPKLEASLAIAFGHLYRLQSRELRRPDVTEHQLQTTAVCDKGGSLLADRGPGNDWRCVVSWHIPGATAVGSAIYQLDVAADGRYVADGDGPKEVNGYFQVQSPSGIAPNPLWQIDGLVDLPNRTSKG